MFSLVPSSGQSVNTIPFTSSCLLSSGEAAQTGDPTAGSPSKFLFKATELPQESIPLGGRGENIGELVDREREYFLVFKFIVTLM